MNDFGPILALYKEVTLFLVEHGIHQWDDTYPDESTLWQNLQAGDTWVMRDGANLIACVTLDRKQDPQFDKIAWAYPSNHFMVIHRLCTHPAYQGRGLARQLVNFAEQHARDHRLDVLRLDAYLGNPVSQKLYRSLGYHEATGYCYYPPRDIMCNCFEKWVGW